MCLPSKCKTLTLNFSTPEKANSAQTKKKTEITVILPMPERVHNVVKVSDK
jgi:hypothetical protein